LHFIENKSVGADPNKPKCRKAKEIRSERKRQKLAAKGIEVCTINMATSYVLMVSYQQTFPYKKQFLGKNEAIIHPLICRQFYSSRGES
jgi:hypothetical protein